MQILRSYLAYAWVLLSLLVLAPLALLLTPVMGTRGHDRCAWLWARMTLLLGGCRISVSGLENLKPGEHYVVVANHQSILDIPALTVGLINRVPMRFMAKRAIFYVPVLGWTMYAFGHVPVDRTSARRTLPGLRLAAKRLQTRSSFVFFPEGTRSLDGKMAPWKPAAFRIAARAGARVLPVTIRGGVEALPKDRTVIRRGAHVELVVHSPIASRGDNAEAVRRLADESERAVAADLRVA